LRIGLLRIGLSHIGLLHIDSSLDVVRLHVL
jgi:hypothetical protein